MRSFREECAMVGTRLRVWTPGKEQSLGLGTYLWMGEILLDSGKKIKEEHCSYVIAPTSPVPPFSIQLQNDMRVFEGIGQLLNTGYFLPAGEKLRIDKVEVKPWNHGNYVAGKFFYRGEPYWLLMSELKLPTESSLQQAS